MDIEEIKCEFGDCDWMRVFLNGYTVDAILWLMDRVEELEQQLKGDKQCQQETVVLRLKQKKDKLTKNLAMQKMLLIE